MNHRERMLAGLPYQAGEDGLPEARRACACKVHEYNHLPPERWDEREALLRGILGKVGSNPEVNAPFHCDYGWNIEVGDNFYANYNLVVLDVAKVSIGNNCLIAPNVGLYTAGHPLHPHARAAGYEYGLPIVIGNDVWIGGNAVVLPGVTVGDGSTIGAGSVVTRDVPAGVLAAGNPCRVIRPLTEDDRRYYARNRLFPEGTEF